MYCWPRGVALARDNNPQPVHNAHELDELDKLILIQCSTRLQGDSDGLGLGLVVGSYGFGPISEVAAQI